MDSIGKRVAAAGAIVLVVAALIGVIVAGKALTSYTSVDGGHIAVVRNGGPFDNNNIRQVIQPGSSRTYSGIDSSVHKYPAQSQQRFYTLSNEPGSDHPPIVVPTSDGVPLTLSPSIKFEVNNAIPVIEKFDTDYGTRTFEYNGHQYHPYDGDNGMRAFLNINVFPVVENLFRIEVSKFTCTDIVSTCALVQNASAGQNVDLTKVKALGDKAQGGKSTQNLQTVQSDIEAALPAALRTNLGGDYLIDFRVVIGKPDLPDQVQQEVTAALASFGKVSSAQAEAAQKVATSLGDAQAAAQEAQANINRQRGYAACPICGQIDMVHALPPNITTYAPGNGSFLVGGK